MSTAVVLVAVSDHRRRRTSHCHGYAPSSASAPSRTPARLRGTVYPRTYVLSLILHGLFRRQLKTHFSAWRLISVDDVNDYVMHLLRQWWWYDAIRTLLTYLDLNPPTPAGVLDNEAFPPTPITGHSANTIAADSHPLQILLECLSPGLTWTRPLLLLPPSGTVVKRYGIRYTGRAPGRI